MAHLTINGTTVLEARIDIPRTGVWSAEVVSADARLNRASVVLVLGDVLEFHGTVRRGNPVEDSTHLLVVGGGGGFPDEVKPQGYRKAPLRIPLEQALQDVGEELSPSSDQGLLQTELEHWTVLQQPASRAVTLLAKRVGANWRVLTDGRLWLGTETWPRARVGYSLVRPWRTSDSVVVTLDAPLVLPGHVFEGRKVDRVQYAVNPEATQAQLWFTTEE